MSETIERFNEDEFIKDFIKKLENILKKAPIQARAKIIKSRVEVIASGFKDPIIYSFDYEKSVKENIFNLKNLLYEERYPTIEIVSYTEKEYSTSELEELISSGISLTEALSKSKLIKKSEVYKINRVLITKDHLFLKNIHNEEDEKLYRMKMPLSIFLKRMREKWNTEETTKMFKEYAEFVRIIYPADTWKKLNEEKQRVTFERATE